MEDNDLFTNHQHGFIKTKSCVTQLLESIEKLAELLDQGYSVDVIYLDFQNTFDSVPHQRLLKKIYGYGIRGNLYSWIEDFLTYRRQRVVMNSAKSEWAIILSGIPQGSVLGPLLFLLYINDLPSVVQSHIKIFVDDTKLFSAIKDEYESEVLQNDLYLLDEWSRTWQMNFNITKRKVLHLGKKNSQQEIYLMHEHDKTILSSVENVTEHPDLGVLMDTSLSFNKHISLIIFRK